VQKASEYYQLVLNMLCVTQFVASSITVHQAFLCEKL